MCLWPKDSEVFDPTLPRCSFPAILCRRRWSFRLRFWHLNTRDNMASREAKKIRINRLLQIDNRDTETTTSSYITSSYSSMLNPIGRAASSNRDSGSHTNEEDQSHSPHWNELSRTRGIRWTTYRFFPTSLCGVIAFSSASRFHLRLLRRSPLAHVTQLTSQLSQLSHNSPRSNHLIHLISHKLEATSET